MLAVLYTNTILHEKEVQMSQDMISAIFWILGGLFGIVSILLGTLWNMTRKEKELQDAAIEQVKQVKADKLEVSENEKRWEKEIDRLRFEHEKVISRVEGRFEKELENVESRIISRFDVMEANFLRQFEILMEIVKKDK